MSNTWYDYADRHFEGAADRVPFQDPTESPDSLIARGLRMYAIAMAGRAERETVETVFDQLRPLANNSATYTAAMAFGVRALLQAALATYAESE